MSGAESILSVKKWARLGTCAMAICWAGHACAIESGSADKKNAEAQKTREYGALSMSLSLTLSPVDSLRKQTAPLDLQGNAQPEMPLDQSRSLGELGAEIEAIEKLIDARQRLLTPDDAVSPSPKSSVQTSTLPDSGDASSGDASTRAGADLNGSQSAFAMLSEWAEGIGNDGLQALRDLDADARSAALVLALLTAAGFVGYLGWKSVRGAKPSRYKAAGETRRGETGSDRVVNVAAASLGEAGQVINISDVPSGIEKTIHPLEYGMLEEADIYLRFGHGKLAEEALVEAIKLNPDNPHAYLTLLGIYFERKDRVAFDALAQRLHSLGDTSVWTRVAEMGRALDADNPLYH